MRNHKKLYRSIAASLLMLFAGLVLAPTIVTAGFHAANKKPAAPALPQVALESTAPTAVQHKHLHRFTAPTAPVTSQENDKQPVPQAEPEPTGHGQRDNSGPTTFAVSDFEPIHDGGAVFPRGGAGVDVAIASTGSNITMVTRKPNPPTSGNDQPDHDQSDNSQANNNGKPDNGKSDDSTPPTAGGDQHHQPTTDGEQHDEHHDKPADTQVANNHTDDNDNRPHASVPEPSSLVLLAAGILGLVVARRRA